MNKPLFYAAIAFIIAGLIVIVWFESTPINCPMIREANGTMVSGCSNSLVSIPLFAGIALLVVGFALLVISTTKSPKVIEPAQNGLHPGDPRPLLDQ